MRKFILFLTVAILGWSCKDRTAEKASTQPLVKSEITKPPAEFADQKFVTMGKQQLKLFEQGDINAWMNFFADNAIYYFSGGDSLTGKKAILDYWTKRRKDVIRNVQFTNDIWLPIQVNQPQKGPDMPGVWLMSWYQVHVTYSNGKSLSFWTHVDYHFNDQEKVDRAVQYIDRAPINKALGVK